ALRIGLKLQPHAIAERFGDEGLRVNAFDDEAFQQRPVDRQPNLAAATGLGFDLQLAGRAVSLEALVADIQIATGGLCMGLTQGAGAEHAQQGDHGDQRQGNPAGTFQLPELFLKAHVFLDGVIPIEELVLFGHGTCSWNRRGAERVEPGRRSEFIRPARTQAVAAESAGIHVDPLKTGTSTHSRSYGERLTRRRAYRCFGWAGRRLNLCPALKRRTRSGSRMIGQARKAIQKELKWSEKARFGGLSAVWSKVKAAPSVPRNRHHLLDQPLQGRIFFPLGDADDIQLEGAEIERQIEQLQR